MKQLIHLLLASFLLGANSKAQLMDDFNDGAINPSLWNTFYPSFGNSSLLESSGNMRFENGAWLTTVAQFQNPTISGSFSFNGWSYDRFKILVRSDGATIDSHWQNRIGGIGIQFTSGDNLDYGPNQTLQLWDFQTGTLLATAAPTISMNTGYDFLITDSGNEIAVFLNGSATPSLSFVTGISYGNYVEFGNREQAAGAALPPYYVDLAIISIVPEPSGLAMLGSFAALAILKRRQPNRICGGNKN